MSKKDLMLVLKPYIKPNGKLNAKKLVRALEERRAAMERLQGLVQRLNIEIANSQELKVKLHDAAGDAASYSLSYAAMKQRHDRIVAWAEMSKPHLMRLLRAVEKQDRNVKAGLNRPINVTIKATRRHAPQIDLNALGT